MVLLPRIFNQKLENAGNICSRLQAEAVSQFKELLAGYDVLRSFGKKIEWFTEQKLQMSKWKPQGII